MGRDQPEGAVMRRTKVGWSFVTRAGPASHRCWRPIWKGSSNPVPFSHGWEHWIRIGEPGKGICKLLSPYRCFAFKDVRTRPHFLLSGRESAPEVPLLILQIKRARQPTFWGQ